MNDSASSPPPFPFNPSFEHTRRPSGAKVLNSNVGRQGTNVTSKAERDRRRLLVRGLVKEKRRTEEAAMPISRSNLVGLFDFLDEALGKEPCAHSLRLTRLYLNSRSLPETTIIPWLGEFGGFCDCEVLANVENHWRE